MLFKLNFGRGVKSDRTPSKNSNNCAINSRANTLRNIGNRAKK